MFLEYQGLFQGLRRNFMEKRSLKPVFKGSLHISNTGTMFKSGSVFDAGWNMVWGLPVPFFAHLWASSAQTP